jgi:hypothetical protein
MRKPLVVERFRDEVFGLGGNFCFQIG